MARAVLESVLIEIAPFDKGLALGRGWFAVDLPLKPADAAGGGNEAAAAKHEDGHAAMPALSDPWDVDAGRPAVPVRALYATIDQCAAGGEWACTCVALEVAAWLDAASHARASSATGSTAQPFASIPAPLSKPLRLTPEVLSDLVLRGCSSWRRARVDASASTAAGQREPAVGPATAPFQDGCNGSAGMLGFHTALELRNRWYADGGGVCLFEVESSYSQVRSGGMTDPSTTFPAFATAASGRVCLSPGAAGGAETAALRLKGLPPSLRRQHPAAYLLVAAGHCTVASFLADGRVLLFNSLGRCLAPSCRCAHALEFSDVEDFCAYYAAMVAPARANGGGSTAAAAQVEAHRVSRQPPEGGEPELLLYLPDEEQPRQQQ